MRRRAAALLVAAVALSAACGDDERVIVGAGTSIVDSGLMNDVAGAYPGAISIVGGSTAELLELADQNSVAVAIVHDETQELAFVAAHPTVDRRPVFASDFLIVGPPQLVARVMATTPAAVFAEIAANGWTFVTRDDRSGTHTRELALWEAAGTSPAPENHPATGQGMGFTLQVTDQREGFTLVEAGAFRAARDTLTLVPVPLAGTAELRNPYSAILIDESGRPFFEWLIGPEGAAAVVAANQARFGEVVYAPGD